MKKLLLFPIFALLLVHLSIAETMDRSAPLINSISVVEIAKTSAKITWTTDENATSQIASASAEITNPQLVTRHNITLENLRPATVYYFNVTSCDASGNCAKASGKSLSFATLGYNEIDPRTIASNLSKSLTNVRKINYINFSEQNPVLMNIDSREAIYFIYHDAEYALIFPKQTELNTTIRLLPSNQVYVLDYGDMIEYDLNNDSEEEITFKISSIKKTNIESIDQGIKYVKYVFNVSIQDLNKTQTNKTAEARIKFEQNPIYDSKYEPPVKQGDIGVSGSVAGERGASVLTGIIIAALVFAACLFAVFLIKGRKDE